MSNAGQERLFPEELNRKRNIHATVSFENVASNSSDHQFDDPLLLLYNFFVCTNNSTFATFDPFSKQIMLSKNFEFSWRKRFVECLYFEESYILSDCGFSRFHGIFETDFHAAFFGHR